MANIFSSSIGKKLIMSISGVFLVIFLLVHLTINLLSLFGPDAFNAGCAFMELWFIQIMVPALAFGFFIHIVYAIIITLKNQKARPVKYAVSSNAKASTWASRNMFVLGLIVVGFLALHLTHFWYKMQWMQWTTGHGDSNPYGLLVNLFSQPVYVVVYLVWIWALWFHLCHGFWSALQTVGFNNTKWLKRWQCIAKLYATVVAVGFSAIPLFFIVKNCLL
jgi:succinate dehydrogenase / fumarate reductase cytochrome b subunit